jgi:hypothetical protein
VVPAHDGDVHRPLSVSETENILSIFSIQYTRVVSNDFCIQFENQWIQLPKDQTTLVCRKDTVVIEKRIDGTLHVKLRERYLRFTLLPKKPQKQMEKITALVQAPVIRIEMRRVVPHNHPWKSKILQKTKIASTEYNATY